MAKISLGELVASVIMDDSQFQRGATQVEATMMGLTGSFSTLGEYVGGAFVTLMQAGTAAVTGIVGASVYVGASFEETITRIGVLANATTEQFGQISEAAREMAQTSIFSAQEVAGSMEALAQAGFDVETIIAGAKASMDLAAASGGTLNDATSITASTITQFGLSVEDVTKVADTFTAALNRSQLDMEDLTYAMRYAGPIGASFGMTLDETTAAVAQFSNLGLKGSKAGTAFRMSMSEAANVTKKGQEVLEKYNLTAQDINPTLHNFGEIMRTIGEAGMTTNDVLKVFGTEAGGAVATLAAQAVGAKDAIGGTYDEILAGLQNSAGLAEETSKSMLDNVMGSFRMASAAGQEFLLTLYDSYAEPLSKLLEQVGSFLRAVTREFAADSYLISDAVGGDNGVLTMITEWLAQNENRIAKMVVTWTERFLEVVRTISMILPILDEIVVVMGAVWALGPISAFAQAITGTTTAVGALQFAVGLLELEITEATAGIYLLVIAVGIVVAALGTYIASNREAEASAERLTAAQFRQTALADTALAKQIGDMRVLLAAQQERANAELDSGKKLDDVRRQELNRILDLDAAQAVLAVRSGELVQVGDELRTVQSLVNEEMDTADTTKLTGAREELRKKEAALAAQYDDLHAKMQAAQAAVKDSGEDINNQWYYIGQTAKVATSSWEDARAKLDSLGEQLDEVRDAQHNLANETSKSRRALIDDEQAAIDAEATRAGVAQGRAETEKARAEEAADAAKKEQEEKDKLIKSTNELRSSTEKLGKSSMSMIEGMQKRADKYAESLRRIQKTVGGAAQAHMEALQKGAEVVADAVRVAEDRAIEIEERKLSEARRIEQERAREVIRIRENLADKLRSIEGLSDQERAALTAKYIADSADAESKADEDARKRAKRARLKALGEALKDIAQFAQDAASILSRVADTLGNAIEKFSSLFKSLTGFSFSFQEAFSAVAGREEGSDPRTAARDFVRGLIEQGSTFLQAVVSSIPVLIQELARGVPMLIRQVANAIPVIVDALVEGLPALIDGIANAIPKLVNAVANAIPVIVKALVEQISQGLPDALFGAIENLISAIIDAIPKLIMAAVDSLPDMIPKVVGLIVSIIVKILEILPDLISGILQAIPGIITSLLNALIEAIPVIIMAIIRVIPQIILAIILAIPEIVSAIIDAIPQIIYMIISLIPEIIVELARSLPQLLPALITMIFKLIGSIIMAIPKIIGALLKALWDGIFSRLPELASELGRSFLSAISNAFRAIWEAFVAALKDVLNIFKKNDRDAQVREPPSSDARVQGDRASTEARSSSARTSGGGSRTLIQLVAEGRQLDWALVTANDRGTGTQVATRERDTAGVKVGFARRNR